MISYYDFLFLEATMSLKIEMDHQALITGLKNAVIIYCRSCIQYNNSVTLSGKVKINIDEEKTLLLRFNDKLSHLTESATANKITANIACTLPVNQPEKLCLPLLQYFDLENDITVKSAATSINNSSHNNTSLVSINSFSTVK